MKKSDPSGRLAQWAINMQSYDFEIIHRKGTSHATVDAFLRQVVVNNIMVIDDDDIGHIDVIEDPALQEFL